MSPVVFLKYYLFLYQQLIPLPETLPYYYNINNKNKTKLLLLLAKIFNKIHKIPINYDFYC